MPWQHVADLAYAAAWAAGHGQSFEYEGWPSKGSEKMLETPKICKLETRLSQHTKTSLPTVRGLISCHSYGGVLAASG